MVEKLRPCKICCACSDAAEEEGFYDLMLATDYLCCFDCMRRGAVFKGSCESDMFINRIGQGLLGVAVVSWTTQWQHQVLVTRTV